MQMDSGEHRWTQMVSVVIEAVRPESRRSVVGGFLDLCPSLSAGGFRQIYEKRT